MGCGLLVTGIVPLSANFARTGLLTLMPVGFALILPLATQLDSLGGGWGEKAIAALARWSYSLYLVNVPMSVLVYFLIAKRLPRHYEWSLFSVLVYLVASVAASGLISYLVEQPFLRLRGRVALCREAQAARKS